MFVLTRLWQMFKWIGRRFRSLGRFVDLYHGPITVLVIIATLCWTIWWSFYQKKKNDERDIAQDKKNNERDIAQDKKNDERAVAQEERIKRLVDEDIDRLMKSQKANTKQLTENYTKIVSGEISKEISNLSEEMKRLVERNGEMVLDETVRRIVASHGNIERGREDTYKKALDEGYEGDYIFEINQTPGGFGHGVFMTYDKWKPGEVDKKGSTYLLTIEEKKDIDSCFDRYFISKEKSGKRKDRFADPNTQKEIFFFLLAKSRIGRITELPKRQMPYWTLSHEPKIEVLSPFAKLSAVIGHIGDKMGIYK